MPCGTARRAPTRRRCSRRPSSSSRAPGGGARSTVSATPRSTRADMRKRMEAALEAAEVSHLKWSADVWRRARHIFGAVRRKVSRW
eukprot:6396696-Prymnesium_polylepis.1